MATDCEYDYNFKIELAATDNKKEPNLEIPDPAKPNANTRGRVREHTAAHNK